MRGAVIGILSLFIILGVFILLTIANNLQKTPPANQLEKKGRAQYLIDTRIPKLDVNWSKFFKIGN
jgi:hypothetical protein